MKLNLCCGDDLELDDYIHIDIKKPSEEVLKGKEFIQLDLNKDSLPYKSNSIKEIVSYCGVGRQYINDFGFSEIHRVLKAEGYLNLYCAYLDDIPLISKYFMNINCELLNRYYDDKRTGDYFIQCYDLMPLEVN